MSESHCAAHRHDEGSQSCCSVGWRRCDRSACRRYLAVMQLPDNAVCADRLATKLNCSVSVLAKTASRLILLSAWTWHSPVKVAVAVVKDLVPSLQCGVLR